MRWTKVAAAWLAAGMLACAAAPAGAASRGAAPDASIEAREMLRWVKRHNDAGGRPFVIVDKKQARMHVYDGTGRLLAATPVLLGSTPGDHTVPGVGQRAQTGTVSVNERTTPAGRFVTHPGRNLQGEAVVWVDYAAAFAIHRLRPGASQPGRAWQLASATPRDNRSTLGCVVVPVTFYLDVIEPLLGRSRGVVYVLPETRSVRELIRDAEEG